MLRVLVLLLVLCGVALSKERDPGEFKGKPEIAQADNPSGDDSKQITVPADSKSPTVINIFTGKHFEDVGHCAQPKDWKEWGSFSICRFHEWLDAEKTIAIFTVILGIATGFLWWATRNLVKDAKESSRRQLRAYVSVTPEKVLNWTNNIDSIGATFHYKNHGQTPALEVFAEFNIEVLADAPNLDVIHVQADYGIAIFPQEDVPAQLVKSPRLSHEEAKDVEADRRRVHIWGKLHYRDVFGESHLTAINVSFGGADFAKGIRTASGAGWNWSYGPRHNESS